MALGFTAGHFRDGLSVGLERVRAYTLSRFLTRDSICLARYMLSPVRLCVRLSVCPSVTRVIHTKTVEDRIIKFSPYGSPIPLFIVG